MFRTRDFILVLTTVAFLLIAIGYTVIKPDGTGSEDRLVLNTVDEISTVSATVASTESSSLSRAERLEELRKKVAASELVFVSDPSDENEPETTAVVALATSSAMTLTEPLLCPNYSSGQLVNWPLTELQVEAVEGVRQYYVTREVSLGVGTTSSTTLQKAVYLALPTKFVPVGQPNCLPSDVVGVALDGSLIRNNEIGLYGIFSDSTLLGYALDGFPIYGVGTRPVDRCGGRIDLGQYRYELQADSDVLLNCFAGTPQGFLQ
jgi:hypothetical protein